MLRGKKKENLMRKTHKSLRLHIGIFGRRNAGKSSILNGLTRQSTSIVSDIAGTTTDPVEKPMELLPIGPVLFIDTAGIDDVGKLGEMRNERTRQVFTRTDIAIIVVGSEEWTEFEDKLFDEFEERKVPVIVIFNKTDLYKPNPIVVKNLEDKKIRYVETVATENQGLLDVREALIRETPLEIINPPTILGDLVNAGDLVTFVVPIDKEAPKGRLIMPQVQSIRDILDNDSYCMVVKERELRDSFDRLKTPPALVVTDSQAFLKVAADTPEEIPMTSFSILFARFKGDLAEYVRGATCIDKLKSGSKVLIAESCSHHPITEDIGTVKIPRWLTQYVGGKLDVDHCQGHDYPTNLSEYDLVIHCGSCMFNRREVLSRVIACRKAGVPVTNYGLTIAYSLGIFERALQPFPDALEVYHNEMKNIK